MSKRSWMLAGIGVVLAVGISIPAAAGGTSRGADDPGAPRHVSASLRSSNVSVHCDPGDDFGSASVPVFVKGPRARGNEKHGTNARVSWTVDRASAGTDQRFVRYNAGAKFTNAHVPCPSPRSHLVCRLAFRLHPLRLRFECHRVDPAS